MLQSGSMQTVVFSPMAAQWNSASNMERWVCARSRHTAQMVPAPRRLEGVGRDVILLVTSSGHLSAGLEARGCRQAHLKLIHPTPVERGTLGPCQTGDLVRSARLRTRYVHVLEVRFGTALVRRGLHGARCLSQSRAAAQYLAIQLLECQKVASVSVP